MELIASSGNKFERLLARGSTLQKRTGGNLNMANSAVTADDGKLVGFKASASSGERECNGTVGNAGDHFLRCA
jgi:hypothetical protein